MGITKLLPRRRRLRSMFRPARRPGTHGCRDIGILSARGITGTPVTGPVPRMGAVIGSRPDTTSIVITRVIGNDANGTGTAMIVNTGNITNGIGTMTDAAGTGKLRVSNQPEFGEEPVGS